MARIDNIKRILKEDFPEKDRQLVDKLAYIINNFMEQVTTGFNKNINFDNLQQEQKDVVVTVDASGIPTIDTSFKNNLTSKINGIEVIRAENLTNTNTYPTATPFISYTENNKIVNINHVAGLPASNKFKLRIITIV